MVLFYKTVTMQHAKTATLRHCNTAPFAFFRFSDYRKIVYNL